MNIIGCMKNIYKIQYISLTTGENVYHDYETLIYNKQYFKIILVYDGRTFNIKNLLLLYKNSKINNYNLPDNYYHIRTSENIKKVLDKFHKRDYE